VVGSAAVARRGRLERNLFNQQLAELADDGRLLGKLEQATKLERECALEGNTLVVREVSLCLGRTVSG
jgi:hypothetical protein